MNVDPVLRPTVEDLLKHQFVNLNEKELKESMEASNFISFFSIVASQKSMPDRMKTNGSVIVGGETPDNLQSVNSLKE